MTDRKEIKRDDLWKTLGNESAFVVAVNMPGPFPVLAWAPSLMSYRLIHARLDGTVNSRPGVAHPDDLVERLA